MSSIWKALIVAPALALLASAQNPGSKGINFYSPQKEIALGQKLASELEQQLHVVDEPIIGAYLGHVGRSLAAQPEAAPYKYSFRLVREERPGSGPTFAFPWRSQYESPVEPIAVPGGAVLIPVAVFQAAENEAQFAGLLAHAIIHIAHRHGTRMATRLGIANQAASRLPASVSSEQASRAMPLSRLHFLRLFENDADREAVVLMAGAGYDPAELLRLIERVTPDLRSSFARVFATHATKLDRVQIVRSAIEKLPLRSYRIPDENFERIRALVSQLPPD